MLTVAPLASGQAQYYLSLTASAYYTQGPEPDGSYYGLGAESFGISGTVSLVAVPAILAGAPVLHADRDFDVLARHTPLEVVPLDD